MAPALGGHRARAAADEDDQVRLIDDATCFRRPAVGAHDAHRQRMLLADRALAADGGGDRGREPLRKLAEFLFRAGNDGSAATDKDRLSRIAEQLRRPLDEIRIGRHAPCRVAAEARIAPHVGALHRAVLHIERQRDVGCAWPAGGHLIEGGAENARDVLLRGRAPRSISSPDA